MRYLCLAAFIVAMPAYAQEAQNSHTLNEQAQRVSQGQPPIPAPWERTPNAPVAIQGQMAQAAPQGTASQVNSIDSEGSGAIPSLPLPVQKTNTGITFITGGVGDEEEAELKSKSGEFNVHLMLTSPHGAFLSDVHLTITDSAGAAVLDINGAGPYMYAKLNPGSYTLNAAIPSGESKQLKFTLSDKGDVKEHLEFHEEGMTTEHKPTSTIE